MTIMENLCGHLPSLSSKAQGFFFFYSIVKRRRIHGGRYGLNDGSVGAQWFINQSQIHFAPLKRVSGSVNTWIVKALILGQYRTALLTKQFNAMTPWRGAAGQVFQIHSADICDARHIGRRAIKVLCCLGLRDQSITRRQLVYVCRRLLMNWTEEEANINHKSWKLNLTTKKKKTSQIQSQQINPLWPHKQKEAKIHLIAAISSIINVVNSINPLVSIFIIPV